MTTEPKAEGGEAYPADYVLPCPVAVAPATVIGKGCTLKTLMQSISLREGGEGFPGAARKLFESPATPAVEALARAASRALDRLWYVNTYGVRNGQAIDADLVIDLKKLLQSEEIAALLKEKES